MNILRGEPLRGYNTLALQSRTQAFVNVSNEVELLAALAEAREHNLDVVALGEGSNIVLAGDIEAMVLRQQSRGIEVLALESDAVRLRVAAGESWHDLVRWSLENAYFGLGYHLGQADSDGSSSYKPKGLRIEGGYYFLDYLAVEAHYIFVKSIG